MLKLTAATALIQHSLRLENFLSNHHFQWMQFLRKTLTSLGPKNVTSLLNAMGGDSTLCLDGGRLNWGKRGKSGERGEAAACHRHNNVCPHISHIPHSGNCTENKSEQCRSSPPGALTPNRHNLGNLGFYSPKYLLPPNNHISFAFGVGRHLEPHF